MPAPQYAVFVIHPDGAITKTIQPKPKYEQLKEAVGGFIETVPSFTELTYEDQTYKRGTAYANEEGMLHHMPYNSKASALWVKSLKRPYNPDRVHLCGPVIFFARLPKETV